MGAQQHHRGDADQAEGDGPGEVCAVLAKREVCQVPVLRGGPLGRVQHAAVHTERVQGEWMEDNPNINGFQIHRPVSLLLGLALYCTNAAVEITQEVYCCNWTVDQNITKYLLRSRKPGGGS